MRCLSACFIALTLLAMLPKEIQAQSKNGLTYLETAGRFADLASEVESRLSNNEEPNSTLIGPLCVAYANLKRYGALFECADKLEARVRTGDKYMQADLTAFGPTDVTALPEILRSQAYLELGDYEKSIESGQRVLTMVPNSSYSSSLWPPVKARLIGISNLALAAALSGKLVLAKEYLELLENVSIPFMGSDIWKPMHANGLARVYLANKQYSKVIEQTSGDDVGGGFFYLLAEALNHDSMNFNARGDSVGTTVNLPKLFMLAKAQIEIGKIAEAKVTFGKLFNNKRLPEIGEIYWLSLHERGRIAEMESDTAGAIEFWRKAVEVIEQQRSSINTEASKIGFVGDKQAVYAKLIAMLIEAVHVAEAFDYVERSKSRALVDMLASKKDFAAPNAEQARLVLAQLDEISIEARGPGNETRPTGVRNLQLARQALQSSAPELSSLVTVTSVPSTELKTLVSADETLIEYYYQGKDLYAFIIDRERLLAVRLDASELSPQVQNLRKTMEEPNSMTWKGIGRDLYQRLWHPLESHIASKSVIVVAHGVLHYLPFSVLQDGEGKFLIDRYSLRFLPSASVLKYLRPVMQKTDAPLLVLGNPDLNDPALDLVFAEGEARLVGAMNPKSRVLLHKEASESNFKKVGSIFTRIHFATHGKFQADDPLKSGLYLAKDADNDGVLTVGELYSMKLEADLVTLSACETGLGKVASGDDVVGLTRGFLYAGSRSIVASLWSVDDKATATLMQALYTNLRSMNKREALRQAQIKTRATFPHPFYWAAFQLTGRAE